MSNEQIQITIAYLKASIKGLQLGHHAVPSLKMSAHVEIAALLAAIKVLEGMLLQ